MSRLLLLILSMPLMERAYASPGSQTQVVEEEKRQQSPNLMRVAQFPHLLGHASIIVISTGCRKGLGVKMAALLMMPWWWDVARQQ